MAVGRWIGGQLGEAGPVQVDYENVLLLAVLGTPAEGDLTSVGRPGRRVIVAGGNASKAGAVGPDHEDPRSVRLRWTVERDVEEVGTPGWVVGVAGEDRCRVLTVGVGSDDRAIALQGKRGSVGCPGRPARQGSPEDDPEV